MGSALDIDAPAKVNLTLHVGERRADGYHRLISLFQMISLYDRIRIRSLKTDDSYRLEGDCGVPAEENIITRAVELFRRRTGLRRGVRIQVEKNIPLGGGLGGGSSDAAAVLVGLNQLFAGGLDDGGLCSLAAELGSDIPFFLGKAAALVSGRGEIVEPLTPRRDYALVLVYPGFPVDTREAYLWLDARRSERSGPGGARRGDALQSRPAGPAELKRMYSHTAPASWTLFNSPAGWHHHRPEAGRRHGGLGFRKRLDGLRTLRLP
jgi:4-diphosphocytidyl-2C-methyl-D-erythritol kinase